MHTIWKGSISFGLVNIPIKLHAATENRDIKLRQLHKECHTPINYKKICSNCGNEVKNEDIVKAYEYEPNKFVILDQEDLERLKKEVESKSVEIIDFVSIDEIDPIYFERSYFLSPHESGGKAYALLREALEKSGKIGIAKIIIRSKEQLAILRVYKNTIVLETIHWPDEVRKVEDVPKITEYDISKKELDTALLLIEQLTTTFDPTKYTDDYRTALMDLIEEKKNDQPKAKKVAKKETPANVTDLMSALEASIERTKKDLPKKRTTTRKTRKNA